METLKKANSTGNGRHKTAHVADAASELLKDSRKLANELYKEGVHQAIKAEDNVKEFSDTIRKKVEQNPVASIMIAAGVGFILAALLKK
jgi:ElaB/YqjD/DUF883 family membrane-anchored ribosome-binding protein